MLYLCVHAIQGNTLTPFLFFFLIYSFFFSFVFSFFLPLFFVCIQIRSVFGEGDRVCESKAKGRARAMGLLHLDDG